MIYALPRICPGEWDTQTPLRFWDYLMSARWLELVIITKKKKRTFHIVNFVIPVDHWVKLKESVKIDNYLDITRELKILWNMKVAVIPIVIDALGTVNKILVQGLEDLEIRGRMEIIQTTALLRSLRILRRVLETWGVLLSLKLLRETIG